MSNLGQCDYEGHRTREAAANTSYLQDCAHHDKFSAASVAARCSDVIRLSLFASFNALINNKYLEVF